MQRVEEMLDGKTSRRGRETLGSARECDQAPPSCEKRALSRTGGEETAYEDAFAALTLNDRRTMQLMRKMMMLG